MLSNEIFAPKSFIFDTSKFIFGGRRNYTAATGVESDVGAHWLISGGARDHADFQIGSYTGDYGYAMAKNCCVVRTYHPSEGNTETHIGKSYSSDWTATVETARGSLTITADEIHRNHANSFYLKQYIRQTQGYDLFEDTFPILEGNVFFEGPDPAKQSSYNQYVAEISESYSIGSVTDALNFNRLVGEAERSIPFSGEKYRNRIVYPKMFERTFCVFIHTSEWENSDIVEGEFHDELPDYDIEFESLGSDQVRVQHGFNQYYCTINILPYVDAAGDPE